MFRALFVAAALALMASACGASKCGELCSMNMPCGDPKLTCVQSRCLMDNGDAGPTTCN